MLATLLDRSVISDLILPISCVSATNSAYTSPYHSPNMIYVISLTL
jgi:hypothetical protein